MSQAIKWHQCFDRTKNRKRYIFTLNDSCFKKIFGWLSLKDLNSISQTCKRLHKITSEYFLEHFAGVDVHYGKDGPIAFDSIRVDAFCEFVQKLSMNRIDLSSFQDIEAKFKSLKEIHLVGVRLTVPKTECLKEILQTIEILETRDVEIEVDFYEHFLKFCNNLKRLSVRNLKVDDLKLSLKSDNRCSDNRDLRENNWLHQKYTKLTHIELIGMDSLGFCDLLAFFKQNSKIRSFSTDTKFLSRFEHLITEADVNLDELTIFRDCKEDLVNHSISSQLNHLHKLGFFKRLIFQGGYLPFEGRPLQNQIDQISQLKPLKSLRFRALVYVIPHVNLSELIRLKELSMVDPQMGTSIVNLASELLNLERISFTHAFLYDITPFVTRSKKLKEIHLYGDIRSGNNVIHLRTLNRLRTKLKGTCKVTIHANDEIYTETKWTVGETNFSLIELKRS